MGLPQGRGGRLISNNDLRVEGFPNIFAAGDVGSARDDPAPQLARAAIEGGRHSAKQIHRLLAGRATTKFRYRSPGTMATIGRGDAVYELPNHWTVRGRLAWFGWLAVHVTMLSGPRSRASTVVNLAVRYLRRPSTDLIVGDSV